MQCMWERICAFTTLYRPFHYKRGLTNMYHLAGERERERVQNSILDASQLVLQCLILG